jgi:hypothetical protein
LQGVHSSPSEESKFSPRRRTSAARRLVAAVGGLVGVRRPGREDGGDANVASTTLNVSMASLHHRGLAETVVIAVVRLRGAGTSA